MHHKEEDGKAETKDPAQGAVDPLGRQGNPRVPRCSKQGHADDHRGTLEQSNVDGLGNIGFTYLRDFPPEINA